MNIIISAELICESVAKNISICYFCRAQILIKMEDFLAKTFYENTVGQWSIAILIVLGSVIISRLFYWILSGIVLRHAEKTKTKLDDILIKKLKEPVLFAIIIVGIWYAIKYLSFTPEFDARIGQAYYLLVSFNVAWVIVRLLDAIVEEYFRPMVEKSENDLDDRLLPIISKGIKISVWMMAIIIGLDNAGYDVTTMIAGLGLGGLAFAMAAKDTIANLFGGFTIITDKPFTISDRIQVKGYDGNVKEIGIRSTRIKTFDGRIVVVPNATIANDVLVNVSAEPSRRISLSLGLTYDTDHNSMEKAMTILKEIVAENDNLEEHVILGFDAFNDFSLNINFKYYIIKGRDILGTQTQVNLQILKRFNAEGLEFAFPTQTIFASVDK